MPHDSGAVDDTIDARRSVLGHAHRARQLSARCARRAGASLAVAIRDAATPQGGGGAAGQRGCLRSRLLSSSLWRAREARSHFFPRRTRAYCAHPRGLFFFHLVEMRDARALLSACRAPHRRREPPRPSLLVAVAALLAQDPPPHSSSVPVPLAPRTAHNIHLRASKSTGGFSARASACHRARAGCSKSDDTSR